MPLMASSSITHAAESLRRLLDQLAPVFVDASRLSPASLHAMKNLEARIAQDVVRILGEGVYPASVEADLLALRQLFAGMDWSSPEDFRHRLTDAKTILNRLIHTYGQTVQPGQDVKTSPGACGTSSKQPSSGSTSAPPESGHERSLWNIPIRYAKGVGPKRALLLEKLGIQTIEDALWFVPWRYEDRSKLSLIAELTPGTKATVAGVINQVYVRQTRRKGMTLLTLRICDQSGSLEVLYFNQPYLEKWMTKGTRIIVSGLVSFGSGRESTLQMKSPHYEIMEHDDDVLLHTGRIVPIYHETRGLTSRQWRRICYGLLAEYLPQVEEVIPPAIVKKFALPSLAQALEQVHFPHAGERLEALDRCDTPAHARLIFEECFLLQLALALRRQALKSQEPGISFRENSELMQRFRAQLAFQFTPAQERVMHEIRQDMERPAPMNRLLQGDVGSGKTVVALYAMLVACGSGYQAALMAPTEILAEQHFLTMQGLLEALGIHVVLVKGGSTVRERDRILQRVRSGDAQIVIGTHALIQGTVQFAKLGLVIVDEQHKFGVLQRAALLAKGQSPDVLVMTATPIPRTLAMTAYGDLDVSVIDSLPPGRQPITTRVFWQNERHRAYQLVRDELRIGRQAYVVYPLVEESEKVDLEAAIQAAERLQREEFPDYVVGLLHGRMKAQDKAQVMAAFKAGAIQILVSTTVIEVGVDVPNATVILIEHADRFGLAQLHQLRGRVGRGPWKSFCLLISSSNRRSTRESMWRPTCGADKHETTFWPSSPGEVTQSQEEPGSPMHTAQQRLQAMVTCSDGFSIAEQDLRIRGPGDVLGIRQWGIPELRVANLIRDGRLLELARQEAFALIEHDPQLTRPEHQRLKAAMLRRWQQKLKLASVG
ncbi:MAG: ATP-dependent DNA helicase RecG [Nitrospirae bacterium]|nr:MAG: ATP-dependent DNA helicase RecG [Nitrospirota bacterium]